MTYLTQLAADLLYSALGHLHDDRYSLIDHLHDERYLQSVPQQDHGGLAGLGDDDHGQYYNQARGDARYAPVSHLTSLGYEWFPFGVYSGVAPFSAYAIPYAGTLGRTVTFVSWAQSFYIDGANNSTNYWKIRLYNLTGTKIKEINTIGVTSNVWGQVISTIFDILTSGTTQRGLYVDLVKVGAPGSVYLAGPALLVSN